MPFSPSHQVQGFSSWHSLRKFRSPKNDNPSDNLAITICWKLAPGKEGGPVTGPKPSSTTTTTIPAAAAATTATTTTTTTSTTTTTTAAATTTSTTTTTTSMTYEPEGWCRKQQNPVKRYGPPKKTITLQKHTRQLKYILTAPHVLPTQNWQVNKAISQKKAHIKEIQVNGGTTTEKASHSKVAIPLFVTSFQVVSPHIMIIMAWSEIPKSPDS